MDAKDTISHRKVEVNYSTLPLVFVKTIQCARIESR